MQKIRMLKVASVALLICLVVVLPLIGACAPAEEQPVAPPGEKPSAPPSGAVFKVASLSSISGPLGIDIWMVPEAMRDYYRWQNEEESGIQGIPIEYSWIDNEYKAPKTLSGFKRLAEEQTICIMMQSSTDNEVLRHLFEKEKIVGMNSTLSTIVAVPPGWIFSDSTKYSDLMTHWLEWVKANWKETRAPKVYCILYDLAIGHCHDRMPEYARDMGIDMKLEFIPFVVGSDYTGELIRARDWGADWVFTCCGQAWIAQFVKDMDKLGLTGKMGVCGTKYNVSSVLPGLVGDLAEGVVMPYDFATWTDDSPAVKQARQIREKYHPGEPLPGDYYFAGFSLAHIITETIGRAYEAEGWPVTGANFKTALEGLKDFDNLGATSPITFGPDRRVGVTKMRIVGIKQGQLSPLTPWAEYTEVPWEFEAPE